MRCSREQIDGCRLFDFIAQLFERGAVARERCRVAGDIHYPVGSHFCGGFYRLLGAALARRVEDYHLRALALAEKLFGEGKRPEVIVLDPPRKGCSEQTIKAAAKMAPDRIVYVSCDPATLARDCAAFKELGYEVEEATPVDLFPRTAHVETVCLLSRAI